MTDYKLRKFTGGAGLNIVCVAAPNRTVIIVVEVLVVYRRRRTIKKPKKKSNIEIQFDTEMEKRATGRGVIRARTKILR